MKQSILIADDVELNREMLTDIFEEQFDILEASDGYETSEIISENKEKLCAVLLDLNMPGIGGMDILKGMKKDKLLTHIPVLMITTDSSLEIERKCLEVGATDFIKKPFDPVIVKTRVLNAVSLYSYKNNLEDKVSEQMSKLKKTNHKIVSMLGNLVESRNLESGEHVQRVSAYTRELAETMMAKYPEYGLTPKMVDIIADAAALHDIGKIAIADAVLLKPGKLTDEEFEIMKTHTTLGSDYIKTSAGLWDAEYYQAGYEIARYHHERYDGKGYPENLKEDEIPISAQLVSVADVYDALTHERCYKKAFTKTEAYKMIINGECGNFSPKLLECFKICFPFTSVEEEKH